MRRIIKTVCATALCVVLFTGCSQPAAQSVSTETSTAEVEPLKIEFKEAEITKRTDTKSNIPEYTIISDSNEKYDVVWTSSDESVAKVEEGMLCTGKEGSAQITATIDDGVSASITVNVERKTRKASSYTHSSKSVSQEYQNALTKGLQYANQLHQDNLGLVFKISEENKQYFKDMLFFYMVNFTVAHEYGHIAHGHLKDRASENSIDERFSVVENISDEEKRTRNWNIQLRESIPVEMRGSRSG